MEKLTTFELTDTLRRQLAVLDFLTPSPSLDAVGLHSGRVAALRELLEGELQFCDVAQELRRRADEYQATITDEETP
jgi:hypothetical protein